MYNITIYADKTVNTIKYKFSSEQKFLKVIARWEIGEKQIISVGKGEGGRK